MATVLSILSYCGHKFLRAKDKPSQSHPNTVFVLIISTLFASQLLWFARYLQFSIWAVVDLIVIILVICLICYAFYLDSKRSRAVIVYFCMASSLLTLTLISECLRYFSST
ncbi:MAG: hypothetical protein OFPI_24750 [Osedax symbiont Rs2]|nr:MAG: hypothetical protein OFPI_24750 [Osedax symbiont Rs2]